MPDFRLDLHFTICCTNYQLPITEIPKLDHRPVKQNQTLRDLCPDPESRHTQ